MLIFRLFSVIILVFLNGCASSPEKPSAQEEVVEPVKIAEPKKKTEQSEVKTAIDPDVMYMLMAAELAGQRGQYAIALEGYMEAAKRVSDPRFAERAAKIAMYMRDSNKTDEAISLWLKQDPNNPTARKIAALSALRAGNKQAAVDHLSAVLKTDPAGFEKSALELASVLQRDGKSDFFYEVLDSVGEKNPDQAVVYFVQSLLAAEMKNNALAEKKVQQALNIQPDWDKALVFQAQIAVFSGDLNKAKTLLRNASLKYPENDKFKKLLAQVLIKATEYEAASEVYQGIILSNPKDAESQIALALVYLQLNRDGKAEDIFKQLLDQPEWQNQANFYLGKIEEKREHTQKALAWFDKVTEGPLVFESAISAVSLLVKDKKFDEADVRLNLLSEQFPKQKLRIILMRAGLYGQQGQYEKAFKLLTEAMAGQPDQRDLLYTRALMAERLNKLDVLEADLKKILAKYPDDAEALNALGYSLLGNAGRYADAEKYLQQALNLQPNEAVIMDSFGWLQYKLGRLQQALGYLERAYAKQQEGEIAAHLAEVLWALGRKEEARKVFSKAIKKAPEDEYLLDFKNRLLSGEE
ncbi:tetratricopeptide repeat protein [Methylobacter tundripaludum]|uniref:Tetratricopeptide TPR_2 repeat-containing protein n=1 Tax=Methylobacter tundripaludum (strain ATCC BAA-1195 / DSM 17260 / SV96) TaxID=697282 RepID=G3ITE0_METTV|nr:tetratricopeptide repeat protein [Methylobacter tundripaludum]EGW22539.1 Tetratricopeptide TPR_2 repeat-containing protein [Methylobacter tundripaludum SV96]